MAGVDIQHIESIFSGCFLQNDDRPRDLFSRSSRLGEITDLAIVDRCSDNWLDHLYCLELDTSPWKADWASELYIVHNNCPAISVVAQLLESVAVFTAVQLDKRQKETK